MTKIYLGKFKKDNGTSGAGEAIYLTEHTWDCNWYWGFGYIGNSRNHFHFDSLLKDARYASEIFESTNISDKDWWIIRDLFIQAYALKSVAEIYQYGGHQNNLQGVTDIIKNKEKADIANADLKIVLDVVWDFAKKSIESKNN